MGVGGLQLLFPVSLSWLPSVIKAEWIFICDQVYVYICKREQCVCVCVHACMREREVIMIKNIIK